MFFSDRFTKTIFHKKTEMEKHIFLHLSHRTYNKYNQNHPANTYQVLQICYHVQLEWLSCGEKTRNRRENRITSLKGNAHHSQLCFVDFLLKIAYILHKIVAETHLPTVAWFLVTSWLVWVFKRLLMSWFYAQQSLEFMHNGAKKNSSE